MSVQVPSKKIQAIIIVILALFFAYFLSTLNVSGWFKSDGKASVNDAIAGSSLQYSNSSSTGSNIDNSFENSIDTSSSSVDAISDSGSTDLYSDPNNMTDSLSKNLFSQFMSLQANNELNDSSEQDLITGVLSNINPGTITPKYSLSDVNVVDTNDTSLKKYGNDLALAFSTLQEGMQSQQGNAQALILYDAFISSLKSVEVPGDLGFNHLQLLNNFDASDQMLVLLENYQSDPVKGLVAFKSLQTNFSETSGLFDNVALEMKNDGILFGKDEPGNIWNNYQSQ